MTMTAVSTHVLLRSLLPMVFKILAENFNGNYHGRRFGALLWQYGKYTHNDGVINENEVTGSVASKLG